MELLYLWIGSYKNIEEQGFKLNPIIEDNVRIKDNTVYIELNEKANYINPFGKQFNIITIAGENGSGKSNIVSALSSIIRYISNYDKKYYTNDNYDPIAIPEKYCLITKENDVYVAYCSSMISFDIKIDSKSRITKVEIGALQNKHLIKTGLLKNKKIKVAKFQPFLKIEDTYTFSFPLQNNINGITKHKLKNYFYYDRFRMYDTVRNLIELMEFNKKLPSNDKLAIFENNNLFFNTHTPYVDIYDAFQWVYKRIEDTKTEDYPIIPIIKHSISKILSNIKKNQYTLFREFVATSSLEKLFFAYAIGEVLQLMQSKKTTITLENDLKCAIRNFKADVDYNNSNMRVEFYKKVQDLVSQKRIKDLLQAYIDYEGKKGEENELKNILKRYYSIFPNKTFNKSSILRLRDNVIDKIETDKKLHEKISKIEKLKGISKNLYKKSGDKVFDFMSLSTGEQRLLRFFADIYFIANMQKIKKDSRNNVILYVFDEMDLSWHPEWQRKIVLYLIDMFKKVLGENNTYKINLIFTTHSPFILSDMPKENIILLKKDKNNGKCILNKCETKTFASNIHTLFAKQFFMKSTIGAYSENTIKEIVSQMKDKKIISSKLELLDDGNIYKKILLENLKHNPRVKCEKNNKL